MRINLNIPENSNSKRSYIWILIINITFSAILYEFVRQISTAQENTSYGYFDIFAQIFAKTSAIVKSEMHERLIPIFKNMSEVNLAQSFLLNQKKLSLTEQFTFQATGLSHLLSVSGGQLVPLLLCVVEPLAALPGQYFQSILPATTTLKIQKILRFALSLFVALAFSLLFGGTGSLWRVALLSVVMQSHFIKTFFLNIYGKTNQFSVHTCARCALLFLFAILIKNPWNDFSFLFSALGAVLSSLSIQIINLYIFKLKIYGFNKIFLQYLLSSFASSLLISVVLSFWQPANYTVSCLANVLALPLVTWVITPLSLVALLAPSVPGIAFALNESIALLHTLAKYFSSFVAFSNPFQNRDTLFSEQTAYQIGSIIIFVWCLLDLAHHFPKWRRLYLLR